MTKKVDGRYYNKPLSKNKCTNCKQEFVTFVLVKGKWRSLHGRKNCLECLPYDCGKKSACNNTIKICTFCNKTYEWRDGKGHKRNYCNTCKIKIGYTKRKKLAISYKGGKCIICGYDRCLRSLCFHHVNPAEKEFTIGNFQQLSWVKLKKELDKCVLLCSNCHGEVHEGIKNL